MAARQFFLSWDQCPLTQTVEWLVAERRNGKLLDLSEYLVVLNSSHAQSRLQEMLVSYCSQHELVYTPATFLTVGQLPEKLYQPQRPFASSIAQRLMWVRALQSMSGEQLQAVIPNPPEAEDFPRWLNIAQSLAELHHDLASEMKRFFSGRDVAVSLNDPQESARWEFLVEAQLKYWDELNRAGLWDRQTARMIAVDHNECSSDKKIVMVGTVDLNQVVRAMLLQVEQHVSILTFAGDGYEALFDHLGCLNIDLWCDKHIDIPQQHLSVVDRPQDQADAVVRFLSSMEGKYRADQITIGVPDDSLVPYLESELDSYQIPYRYARGPSLLTSSFFRLVEAIGDFAATRDYVSFAALVRHPELSRHISARCSEANWLAKLDQWYERHLQNRIPSAENLAGVTEKRNTIVRDVVQCVLDVLAPLLESELVQLNHWPDRWNRVLQALLGDKQVHSQDPHDRSWIKSISQFSDSLQQFQQLDNDWVFEVHCGDFLRMVFAELKSKYIAPAANPQSISLLGWLDTPLDDAAISVVTSFNEGLIPSSDPAHPFLTQSLRKQLNLLDNRRRYARDAYAIELLINSRQNYHLIVGKQNPKGEPRTPSRLLMAMPVDQLPYRARFLFGETESDETLPVNTDNPSLLEVPKAILLAAPIQQVRVTDFKAYLACPYRFYLQKVLKLGSVDDQMEEMTGGQFGELLHNVLEDFGKSDLKDSTEAEEIKLFLESEVEKHAATMFGKSIRASLRLQLTQAKLRLEQFAWAQAEHRRKGWVIKHLEKEASYSMMVDDEPLEVIGRLDRIDENESDGRWLILDYKTGDSFHSLEKLYFKKKQWVDLQLPLYQQLVKCLPDSHGKSISLGLIALPKKLDEIRFEVATWDDAMLRTAFQLADEVVRKIRAEDFWPPKDDRFFDQGIERICQTGVLKLD